MNEIETRIEEVKKEIVDTRRIYQDKPDGKKSFKGLYKVEEKVRVLEAELKALTFCNDVLKKKVKDIIIWARQWAEYVEDDRVLELWNKYGYKEVFGNEGDVSKEVKGE